MEFPIITLNKKSIDDFILFWSNLYDYKLEKEYHHHINNHKFDLNDLTELYKWKNGGNLSSKKEISLKTKILKKIEIINELKMDFQSKKFNQSFEEVSAIWKIFLLHIITPKEYPILDQHVARAYYFLTGGIIKEIPFSNKNKVIFYYNNYLKFFNEIAQNTKLNRKKIDEALFMFGKFIKTYPKLFDK